MAKKTKTFTNSMLCHVSYKDVIKAMSGEYFNMSLVGKEAKACINAVNQGIDAHLEACNCPERGDSYNPTSRMVGKTLVCAALDCTVSPESMPTLLRRLSEDGDDNAMSLADGILQTLGFNDYGKFVGKRD